MKAGDRELHFIENTAACAGEIDARLFMKSTLGFGLGVIWEFPQVRGYPILGSL